MANSKTDEYKKQLNNGGDKDQRGPYIGLLEDYPKEFHDNNYLKRGYRIGYHTWSDITKSFFEWHNESLNVWTHFGGACMFLTFALYVAMVYPCLEQEAKFMYEDYLIHS